MDWLYITKGQWKGLGIGEEWDLEIDYNLTELLCPGETFQGWSSVVNDVNKDIGKDETGPDGPLGEVNTKFSYILLFGSWQW